jgi:mono/diheme cytochrome c family protein
MTGFYRFFAARLEGGPFQTIRDANHSIGLACELQFYWIRKVLASEVPMSRLITSLTALSICLLTLSAQQSQSPQKPSSLYAAIPVEAAKQQNPVKSSPESLARAKKWWTIDCAMCHGANGDGKGDLAKDMKVRIADFTNADSLKDRTDGEIFYLIKNGYQDMPPEGPRVKTEENWDLVNYVRSLAKPTTSAESGQAAKN